MSYTLFNANLGEIHAEETVESSPLAGEGTVTFANKASGYLIIL